MEILKGAAGAEGDPLLQMLHEIRRGSGSSAV
jgi:hypothetical protein